MDAKDERDELLQSISNLASLIKSTDDPAKAAEYVDQFYKLKAKLIALGPAKKSAGQP
jgi:hypothetical protein